MAITAYKVFVDLDVLPAADLNLSFAQIINNAVDLWSPATKAANMGGFALFLDSGATKSIASSTGGIAISSDITALGVAIARVKTATTSRASTATLADDPHLVVPLGVGTWGVEAWIMLWGTTSGAGGFRMSTAFSGTATGAWTDTGSVVGVVQTGTQQAYGATVIPSTTITVGTVVPAQDWLKIHGTITVTVAGNLSFQWAQNSSNANAANVGIGSWLTATKVG